MVTILSYWLADLPCSGVCPAVVLVPGTVRIAESDTGTETVNSFSQWELIHKHSDDTVVRALGLIFFFGGGGTNKTREHFV